MTTNPAILVVDDEAPLRKAIRVSLQAAGFRVLEAPSGEDAIQQLRSAPVDLVLLDVNLGGLSGFDVCRRLRSSGFHSGIVMVTVRDSENDKVAALEAGADDFVTKPFRIRELVARINAVLRRVRLPQDSGSDVLRFADLSIDIPRRVVKRASREIHLSPKEFDLLALLAQAHGAPLQHAVILRKVWGPEYGGESEYLRTYIRMLRAKIEDHPSHPKFILTEPWVGYRLVPPEPPA